MSDELTLKVLDLKYYFGICRHFPTICCISFNPLNPLWVCVGVFVCFTSLGDGHTFVTRLVHIDPEQANQILQPNGKM